jgi:hypothetical protein
MTTSDWHLRNSLGSSSSVRPRSTATIDQIAIEPRFRPSLDYPRSLRWLSQVQASISQCRLPWLSTGSASSLRPERRRQGIQSMHCARRATALSTRGADARLKESRSCGPLANLDFEAFISWLARRRHRSLHSRPRLAVHRRLGRGAALLRARGAQGLRLLGPADRSMSAGAGDARAHGVEEARALGCIGQQNSRRKWNRQRVSEPIGMTSH